MLLNATESLNALLSKHTHIHPPSQYTIYIILTGLPPSKTRIIDKPRQVTTSVSEIEQIQRTIVGSKIQNTWRTYL